MEKKFSPEQESAISTRDRTLLVSAAAGSGKTTTLTERIIRSLLDEKKPESLQNMLIVTFTNAATQDLQRKIGEALRGAMEKNPADKRLERELYLLPSAKISTIDSFCNDILRSNADRVGVPPNYRLAENAEITILTEAILDSLINAAYEGDLSDVATPKEFEALASSLTDSRTTKKLTEIFRLLHTKSKSATEGVDIYFKYAEKYKVERGTPIELAPYGTDLIKFAGEMLEYYAELTSALALEVNGGTPNEELDAGEYFEINEIIMDLAGITTYNEMREALLNLEFPSMPTCPRSEHTEKLDFCREKFAEIKKAISKIYTDFFVYTEDEWHELFSDLHAQTTTLAKFLKKFDEVYMSEKIRRGMLEHADVSRFTYHCLYNPDGSLTDIARSYKERLTSIYIDEYQDVNALQDAIFRAISNDNRFMVGDIKQSIYGFRSAKPEIFAEMKTTFPKLDTGADSARGASVFMSQNFRCDRGIINFTNTVFDRMFSVVRESIGYVGEDALVFSKVYPDGEEPPYTPTKIYVIGKTENAPEDDEDAGAPGVEPRFVAKKIRELLNGGTLKNGRAIRPSDIAILLRKRSGIESFTAALAELNIPYETPSEAGFFMNSEVLLALSLLNAIDNPSKDVYLAALMCSPLYDFTADELLKYRLQSKKTNLYRAIRTYADEHPEDEKLSRFLSSLAHYRCLAEGMNVDALLMRLYNETGLLALASRHSGKDNLMLLYNYARKFEGSSFKGLYNFINYVNNVAARDEALDDGANTVSDTDTVKIVTVHSSKGLEYPIVFFAETARMHYNLDLQARVAYSEGYGVSFYLREKDGLAIVRNPIQHIIRKRMNDRYYEEELRVLYVALTRAKESLFVVGAVESDSLEELLRSVKIKEYALSPFGITKLSSFLEMMLAAKGDAEVEFIENAPENSEKLDTGAPEKPETKEKVREADSDFGEVYTTLKDRFTFEYRDEKKTQLPEKMSVSKLSPSVLDGADEEALVLPSEDEDRKIRLPSFVSGTREDESAKRGIATHMVLQFCDLNSLLERGAVAELDRLCEKEFLSKENRARVRLYEIGLFVKSELFTKMKNAAHLYRELRFNTTLPAKYFTSAPERREALEDMTVLVQGVIDCIIEDADGELHLVDYKTDRLSDEEFHDIELATKKLNEKHALQLTYYALAIEKIFGKRPKTVSVYSMPLGKCVPITTLDESVC